VRTCLTGRVSAAFDKRPQSDYCRVHARRRRASRCRRRIDLLLALHANDLLLSKSA
jgi:hypothetical protein